MKRVFYSMLILMLFACSNNSDYINPEKAVYKTTPDSRLYFNNVRAPFYKIETMEASKIDMYSLLVKSPKDSSSAFEFSIGNNWLKSEAFIYLSEYPSMESLKTINVAWLDMLDNSNGEYIFDGRSIDNHFEFATNLYNSLQAGHDLEWKNAQGQFQPLFSRPAESRQFDRIMRDFYELVNLL